MRVGYPWGIRYEKGIEVNLKSIVSLMLIPLVLILVTTLLACTAPISAPASEAPSASTSTPGEIEKEADTPAMEPQHKDKLFGRYPCSADGTVMFTSAMFPSHLITEIEPMGMMGGSHVTPTDHLYIHRDVPLGEDSNYVVAPADGFIVKIERFGQDRPLDRDNPLSPTVPDYRLIFMHSCTVFTIFIHIGELALLSSPLRSDVK